MTSYIPYAQQWFVDGLNEVDLRTTDRCVKNDHNQYRPVWLPNGSSIKGEVIKMIAKRIEVIEGERPAQTDEQPQDIDMDDSLKTILDPTSTTWGTCRI